MKDPIDIVETVLENKKRVLIILGSTVAALAILIGYFQKGPDALFFAEAESAYASWDDSPQDPTLYNSLQKALQKVPSVKEKYEPTIAQQLIFSNQLQEALPMADRSIQRVKNEVPYHADYAVTSLLIEKGSFQEALERAVKLKERMGNKLLQDAKGGSFLYLHNLLRIASLQKKLKNRHGERAALEELELALNSKAASSKKLLDHFSKNNVTLFSYIESRKNALHQES